MIQKERCIVIDVDGTLCPSKNSGEKYSDLLPYPEMIEQLCKYKKQGFYIILYTSRNMRTYEGNIGKIMANTSKVLLKWLDEHNIPHDEIHFGKPWPGEGGFYVDNKTIRPDEFRRLSYKEISKLIADE